MLTTRAFLLPHYRQALTEALANCARPGSLPFANGDPESWATDAEAAGWLDPADAIRIRRLARKVRFYEGISTRCGLAGESPGLNLTSIG